MIAPLLFLCALAAPAPYEDACERVREDIATAKTALADQRRSLIDERTRLREELLSVERRLAEAEREADALQETELTLDRERESAESRVGELRDELDRSWEVLRENRKELEAVLARAEPVGESFDALDALLTGEAATDAETQARELLVNIYIEHCVRAASVYRTTGEVVLPDGTKETGDLLLCGGCGGVYAGDTVRGVVTLPPGAKTFHVVSAGLDRSARRNIEDAVHGTGEWVTVPLDVSDGMAVARLRQARSWWEFLLAGGIVMLPLGLIAILSLAMIAERVIVLRRADARIDPLLARVLPLVERRELGPAASVLKELNGPIGRVLLAGVDSARESREGLEEALEEAVLTEVPRLERFVGTLGVFAAMAPLLGLLGTVSGMIGTFQVITVYGTGNARLLSGGISEALITTEVGLVVAVPILLAHAWLSRRVRTILGHMERAAVCLAGALANRGAGEETDA